jgi:hypothetical protein
MLFIDRLCGLVGLENREYGLGIHHADHVALSSCKSWQSLRRQAAVARSV